MTIWERLVCWGLPSRSCMTCFWLRSGLHVGWTCTGLRTPLLSLFLVSQQWRRTILGANHSDWLLRFWLETCGLLFSGKCGKHLELVGGQPTFTNTITNEFHRIQPETRSDKPSDCILKLVTLIVNFAPLWNGQPDCRFSFLPVGGEASSVISLVIAGGLITQQQHTRVALSWPQI
jgi:hypothetical protein